MKHPFNYINWKTNMQNADSELRNRRAAAISEIYCIKERFTMEFKVLISTLLGQEWTSPAPQYINQDAEGVLWLSIGEPQGYPDRRWCTTQSLRDCVGELLNKELLTQPTVGYLMEAIDNIPHRFEIPDRFGDLEDA